MTWSVTRALDWEWRSGSEVDASGLRSVTLAGALTGSSHMEVVLYELDPEGELGGRFHPFEESFFVLEGELLMTIGDIATHLHSGDFGLVPVAMPHACANRGSGVARWITVRAPQPRAIGGISGVYRAPSTKAPSAASTPAELRHRRVFGSFDWELLPQPGRLEMRGFRSAGATNVGLNMLVDDVLGAVHHTLFMVRFDPTNDAMTLGGEHFHPFEEAYFIVKGQAVAHLEGSAVPVGEGDLVFAGVNTLHGFTNPHDEPVIWIETQSPAPPPSNAFFFRSDWES